MAEWKSRDDVEDHFARHGAEVNARDVAAYARIADEVMARGARFGYRLTERRRVGYYERRRGYFVATDAVTGEVLSLSKRSENYVRALPDSTYPRR